MSSRPRIRKYPVIVNGDMSATSITSSVTIIEDLTLIGYAFSWAGATPVGTISVQVSNDYSTSPAGTTNNAGTWTTITFEYNGSAVTSVPVSGNTGNGFIDIDAMSAYAIRTVYTKGSGTGTLQAIVNCKVA